MPESTRRHVASVVPGWPWATVVASAATRAIVIFPDGVEIDTPEASAEVVVTTPRVAVRWTFESKLDDATAIPEADTRPNDAVASTALWARSHVTATSPVPDGSPNFWVVESPPVLRQV